MAVDPVAPRQDLAGPPAARPAPAADGNFAAMLRPAPPPAPPPQGGAVQVANLALVQAQVEDVFARQRQDKEARRHGRAMLKALGDLQLATLRAGMPASLGAAVDALAQAAQGAPEADDPVLRLILREIDVRAAVELARHPDRQDVSIV